MMGRDHVLLRTGGLVGFPGAPLGLDPIELLLGFLFPFVGSAQTPSATRPKAIQASRVEGEPLKGPRKEGCASWREVGLDGWSP